MSSGALITVGNPGSDHCPSGGIPVLRGGMMQISSPLKEPLDRLSRRSPHEAGPRRRCAADAQGANLVPGRDRRSAGVSVAAGDGPVERGACPSANAEIFRGDLDSSPAPSPQQQRPIDAVGHATLKKKLRGVVQFIQDCAAGGIVGKYDFDLLRRKLGLLGGAAPTAIAAAAVPAAARLATFPP